jgi:hypothetical protein
MFLFIFFAQSQDNLAEISTKSASSSLLSPSGDNVSRGRFRVLLHSAVILGRQKQGWMGVSKRRGRRLEGGLQEIEKEDK